MPDPEPFRAAVERLATEKGLTVSEVRFRAYDPDVKGTNPDTLKSAIMGRRPLHVAQIEAVAKALGVDPAVFHEYRLALARRLLDEREVGLVRALKNLSRLERALR